MAVIEPEKIEGEDSTYSEPEENRKADDILSDLGGKPSDSENEQ
jgi:hypothetical protein